MLPLLPHAFAELSEDFHTLQNWEGFDNPFVVIENSDLKNELGINNLGDQQLLNIFNGTEKIKSLKPLVYGLLGPSIWSIRRAAR